MSFSEFSEEKEQNLDYSEFVLIDDRTEESQYTYFGSDLVPRPLSKEKESDPKPEGIISPRFLCFLGLIFCLIFGIGVFIGSLIFTCLAAFSLFRNSQLNEGVKSFWSMSFNTAVAGLGFMLGLVSPTLGLGFIALYFSLKGNLINDNILRTFIHKFI